MFILRGAKSKKASGGKYDESFELSRYVRNSYETNLGVHVLLIAVMYKQVAMHASRLYTAV